MCPKEITPLRLPLIEISDLDLKPGTDEWDTVKGQVQEALKEYGCFEVKLNKVPSELSKDVFHVLKELFDLPQETKELNVPEKPFQGYAGPHPQAPLYESIGIDEPNITANLESLSNTFWPQGNKNFRSTMESFLDQVSGLDRMIRRMILESFGLEKYMDEHMNSVKYLLRANRYQGPETTDDKTLAMSSHSDEKTLAMSSHSDRSIITILRQINEVDGLEIQTKDGKWNPVKYSSPDSFIVMIGDSLYAWLNGRVQLPYHRVTMSGNNSRYSLGLFVIPKGGYLIKAPEELVDEQHSLLFKPFDYDEFMKFYSANYDLRLEFPLKSYCGV